MMSKNVLFIKSNIRKSISQIVSICLLIVLSSALMNIILIMFGDFKDDYSRKQKELNCASIDFLYASATTEDLLPELNGLLDSQSQIVGYEVDKTVSGFGTVQFNGGVLSNIVTVTSLSDTRNKTVNKYEIVSSDNQSGVYLSYLFFSGGGFTIGDDVAVSLNGREYVWRVAGFYDALNTGTSNCMDITCILSDELYESVHGENAQMYKVAVKTADGVNAEKYVNTLNAEITSHGFPLVLLDSQIFDNVYSQRYTNATAFQAILVASTAIMVIVMAFVVAISLNNYVNNSIANYGTLKAIGYVSHAMIRPLILEFAVIGLASGIVGVALSYPVLFPICSALESQIGIPYQIKFIPTAAVTTVVLFIAIVTATAYFSVRKIRKIPAISAIRQDKKRKPGVASVNIVKTKISVNTALGLKNCLGNISRSLVVLFVMIGVSFLSGFAVYLSQNVLGNADAVLGLICGQTPDSVVRIDAPRENELVDTLQNSVDVKSFYLYSTQILAPDNHPQINAYIIDGTDGLNDGICIAGKMPQTDEEIAVNKAYASRYGLKIGDRLVMNGNGFTVCGFIQGAYYAGTDCYILRSGYQRIDTLDNLSYYINLNDGADIDAFNKQISATLHPTLVVNQRSYLNNLASMYSTLLKILVVIIIVLSVLIIAFILYVILSILLENKKKEHGILKSLGFVSGEIVYQTVISILPCCLLGTAIGLVFAGAFSNDLIVMNLTNMGIFQFGSKPSPFYLLLCGVALIVFVIVYTVLLSRSVKKIAPHDLFNRE